MVPKKFWIRLDTIHANIGQSVRAQHSEIFMDLLYLKIILDFPRRLSLFPNKNINFSLHCSCFHLLSTQTHSIHQYLFTYLVYCLTLAKRSMKELRKANISSEIITHVIGSGKACDGGVSLSFIRENQMGEEAWAKNVP